MALAAQAHKPPRSKRRAAPPRSAAALAAAAAAGAGALACVAPALARSAASFLAAGPAASPPRRPAGSGDARLQQRPRVARRAAAAAAQVAGGAAAAASGVRAADVAITPRSKDWSAWYLDVIAAADLVDDAPVRGCKILRPNGFAIWEQIQRLLDPKLKEIGVQNAYFPLLIPVSFLSKEANHVEGFAKECAVVTHHRLRSVKPGGVGNNGEVLTAGGVEVDPDSRLAEPFVVRPTSETVVWHMYGRWISSHRDLPLKMNQWVNVMRWEMKTRPFLRSAEFLWQEGHTAHATKEEADAQAREVLGLYVELAQEQLALPLFPGRKSDRERFAGADETYTIEAVTQNGMAIQAGTSHFLGQNFAKAFDVKYLSEEQKQEYVWASSWGVSTRLIGAVIMVHSDDDGLVLPPVVAAVQVVIVPLYAKDPTQQAAVLAAARALKQELVTKAGLRVALDERIEMRPGAKYYEWERRGVPLRLELGAKDLEKGAALAKRRTGGDKFPVTLAGAATEVPAALDSVRVALRERSDALRERLTFRIGSRAQFDERLQAREPGMLLVPWGGDSADEEQLQEQTGVTLRCYPLQQDPMPEGQVCPLTGKPARIWAIFAVAY